MPTTAQQVIERLRQNGIKHVFGLPGDYIIGFFDKLYKSDIEVIVTTSEASAGYAADGYARINGLGCCCVTYSVGGFNIYNAVAQAYAEKSPVIVISGSPGIKERDSKYLLHHMVGSFEFQHEAFSKITCANTVLRDPDRAGYEIDRVIAAAIHFKQPVYIEIPRDMLDKNIRYDPYTIGTPKDAVSDVQNLQEVLGEVTVWIDESKNPVIWAGVEIARFGLGSELIKFAEKTNIPITTTILGKSVINERHPLCLGVYCESLASPELRNIVDNSDCIIMLGVIMNDINLGFLPLKSHRRNTVLCTSETLQVRNHSYQDVTFVDFIKGLLSSKIEAKERAESVTRQEEPFTAKPKTKITSARLFQKINDILNENMTIVADVGNSLFGSLDVLVHDNNAFVSNAFYASMGFAIPGAIGVQVANPKTRPIVIVGDGAFQISGTELSTALKYKLNPIVIVLNNDGYGTERIILDGPYNDVRNWAYEKITTLVGGGNGFKVTTEEELDKALENALETKQMTIINVVLDKKDYVPALKRIFNQKGEKRN